MGPEIWMRARMINKLVLDIISTTHRGKDYHFMTHSLRESFTFPFCGWYCHFFPKVSLQLVIYAYFSPDIEVIPFSSLVRDIISPSYRGKKLSFHNTTTKGDMHFPILWLILPCYVLKSPCSYLGLLLSWYRSYPLPLVLHYWVGMA
jgi:dolichyl-phosphate-mannose--protein O-mannosyl transferase